MSNEIIGYKFNNSSLLQEALTHPSLCLKAKNVTSYERLEFLGDSVLSLIIIDYLIKKFPLENEGKLAKRKAGLVSGEMLAKIANAAVLGHKIQMSISEEKLGGRDNPNNLENALEAIIGAIYLDSELQTTKNIVLKLWQPYIDDMKEIPIDPKSHLQEELQKRGMELPKYELISQSGPGHMLIFKVSISIPGFTLVIGEGKSKQQAEKEAAMAMLQQLIPND
jgi:ribonuclease-3